ncbi:MAG: glyoxylase I family protein [Phenylobacterium sp.]
MTVFSHKLSHLWSDRKAGMIHQLAVLCPGKNELHLLVECRKHFYTQILGLEIIAENYRKARDSYKLDLKLPDCSQIELFSFPNPPARPSRPEALGLRHLAFVVESIESVVKQLVLSGVEVEDIRIDEYTDKKYTFFSDPDGLPLELYEL